MTGLTNLKTFIRVLEARCHCDFRKMEVLKVNKFGQTYSTGKQVAQAFVVSSYYFFNLYAKVQLVKHDIFTAIIYLYWVEEFLLRKITQQRVFQLLEKQLTRKLQQNCRDFFPLVCCQVFQFNCQQRLLFMVKFY